MNNDYQNANSVRCGVALSIPLVLEYLSCADKKHYEAIRHLLPTYKISGIGKEVVEEYFVPQDLKDTGKRRVYINSNGFRLLYVTRKHISRLAKSMREFYDEPAEYVDKIATVISDRWMLVEGVPHLDDYRKFIDQLVAVERTSSKENHPPCGDGKFVFLDLLEGSSAEYKEPQKFKFEALMGISISKYDLQGILEKGIKC